jgi:hypothetical protein
MCGLSLAIAINLRSVLRAGTTPAFAAVLVGRTTSTSPAKMDLIG